VRLGLGPVAAHFFIPSAVGLEFCWRVAGSAQSWCHLLASTLPAPVPALRPSRVATFSLGVLRPTQCFHRPDFGAAVDFSFGRRFPVHVQASSLSSSARLFSLLEPGVSPARFQCRGRSSFSRRVATAGSISAGASFYNKSCCVFVGASVKLDFLHPGSAGAAQSGLFHRYLFLLPRCVRLCVL
jgi:hypothetical protein